MNKQEEQLVDSSVRDVLKNARIIQELFTKEEKEKMEMRRQKKTNEEKEVLDYLNIRNISINTCELILKIVRDIINTYCSIKKQSLASFKELPEKVTITCDVTTKELPNTVVTYINNYFAGIDCGNDEIKQILKSISMSSDKEYKILFNNMPLVQFKQETNGKYEPAMYDKEYLLQYGFDFEPIPRTSTIGVEIEFSKLEEFINAFLDGTIDLSNYLTEEERNGLKDYIGSVRKTERSMNNFFNKCYKTLQKILPDITKGLLADCESKKNKNYAGEYVTTIPFYITSKMFFSSKHPFTPLHNIDVNEFLKNKASQSDLRMSKWLWDNTSMNDYVCYYPYTNKKGNVTYLPILYTQLKEILERYGLTFEIKATEIDKSKHDTFYMNNQLEIRIKAKDFKKFINLILGNETEDEKEPDTKQQLK